MYVYATNAACSCPHCLLICGCWLDLSAPLGWPLLFAGRRFVAASPLYYVFTAVDVSVRSIQLNCLLCRDLMRIPRVMLNIFHVNVILTTYRFSSVWIAKVQSLFKIMYFVRFQFEFVLFSGLSRPPRETRQISPAAQHWPALTSGQHYCFPKLRINICVQQYLLSTYIKTHT